MIKNSVQHPHVKRIFFFISTLLLVIGFTAFLVKNKGFKTHAYSSDLFATTWQTDVAGATEPNKVTLSFLKAATDSYEVSWDCSDNFETVHTNKITHDYNIAGTYDICVRSLSPLAFYAPDLATDEKAKLQEIKQWGSIKWSNFTRAFQGMKNMQLTATDVPNLSQVTDMTATFEGATSFTGHESMQNWDVSNVNRMLITFRDTPNFNAPISSWITTNVTNMSGLFQNASAFNQPIGGWDTRKVINMNNTFAGAKSFNQPIGDWKTGAVNNMAGMFMQATSFNQDISDWKTGAVNNMAGMFMQATSFNQDISDWNTGNVGNMGYMFLGASAFNQPLNSWNIEKVRNMDRMFQRASAFNQPIGDWDVSAVTNMAGMFHNAVAFNQDISDWNTEKVTSMGTMFYEATAFNNGQAAGESTAPLSWNTASLDSVPGIFQGATAFNQPIDSWNTGGISNMSNMFNGATSFNQPLNSWNTKSVTSMTSMFQRAFSFNQPVDNWNTSKVIEMTSMFNGATSFNQSLNPKVVNAGEIDEYTSWDVSKVTNMTSMFYQAHSFNGAIDQWDTSSVERTNSMFFGATSFNQPIGGWNTANVTTMISMFNGATVFNQDISDWNVGKVTTLNLFLNYSGLTPDNYDKLLNKWSLQTVVPNIPFTARGIYYCTAKPARDILTSPPKSWGISDAGQNCQPQDLSLSNTEIDEHTVEVGYISATDESTIIYSLVPGEGGADNSKFVLDSATGHLSFLEEPDFENPTGLGDPTDANKYHIRVRATDTVGLYSEETFIITVKDIDDVAPVITITAPTKMAKGPIEDTTFTVSDRFSVASVEVDTSSVAAADNIVCTPAFPYENPAPSPENHITLNCTIRITSSGKLVLRATDNAGYSSTATQEGYIIDTLGPTFTVANVDTILNGLHNPVVYFQAEDPVGVKKYEINYTKDNQGEGVSPDITTETVTYTGEVQQLTLSLDPHEDSHVVEIIAYDNVDNTTTRRIIFPPEVTITAPTIISNTVINDTTVTITSPTNGNPIDNIEILGSASAGVTLGTCTDRNDNTDAPYDTTVTCEIHGIQSTGMVEIRAQDTKTGAVGSNLQKYFYDTTPADITINAPTKSKKDNISDVTVTITDNIELYVNGISIDNESTTAGTDNLLCQTDEDDKSIASCTLTITSSGNLTIKVKDRAGNSSTATEENFIIDRIPPEVTIDDPTVVNSNNQTSYTLSGTCTAGDNNPIITIDTQPHIAVCNPNNTWSLVTNLSSYPDGEIAVTAKQTDAVGNQTTKSTTLQKDTILPTVTVNRANGQPDPTNINLIRFSIIFSKPIKEGTLTKEDMDVTGSTTYQKGEMTKISDTEYELELTNLTDGDTITVDIPAGVCTDLAGNLNEASTSADNSITYFVPKPIIPTPLTKYVNPVIETEQEEETADITKEPTPPTQSKSLKIKIYNESGEPLVGVTVEIHSDVRTGITDEKGEVYFENLDTGLHTMIIAYNGYRAEKKINLVSDGEEEMEINIKVEKVIVPNYVYWLIALIVLLTILLGYNIYKRKQEEKK